MNIMNMKNLWISLLIMIGCVTFGLGQGPRHKKPTKEQMEKIKEAKIAFISSRLSLKSEQSQKFWTVYNEYSESLHKLHSQKHEIRRSLKKHKRGKKTLSDSEIKQKLTKMVTLKEQMATLDKNYQEKFFAVLNPNQVLELHQAEREFMRTLRDKAHEHRGNNHRDLENDE